MGEYKTYTIDSLIAELKKFKGQGIKGSTPIYLSDFEFNSKQTKFEISRVDDEKELFLFYEMHEGEWY